MTSKLLPFAGKCRFLSSVGILLAVLAFAVPTHAAAQKVTPTLVIGMWKLQSKEQQSTFAFRADSTFTVELPTTLGDPYIGTGRWRIVGDTVALSPLVGGIGGGDDMPFQTTDPVVWFDNNQPRMTGHFGVYVRVDSAQAAPSK